MNKVQLAYIEAKAIEDTLKAEFARRTAHLWQGEVTEADIEAIAAEEANVSEELGIWEAHDAVLFAEKRLVAWVHERVKADPLYAQHGVAIKSVFAKYRRIPSIRPKVIDICLRLEA